MKTAIDWTRQPAPWNKIGPDFKREVMLICGLITPEPPRFRAPRQHTVRKLQYTAPIGEARRGVGGGRHPGEGLAPVAIVLRQCPDCTWEGAREDYRFHREMDHG